MQEEYATILVFGLVGLVLGAAALWGLGGLLRPRSAWGEHQSERSLPFEGGEPPVGDEMGGLDPQHAWFALVALALAGGAGLLLPVVRAAFDTLVPELLRSQRNGLYVIVCLLIYLALLAVGLVRPSADEHSAALVQAPDAGEDARTSAGTEAAS